MSGRRKALVVIPARLGSSRIPEKPLQEIDGRALILHVCDTVSRSSVIDTLVVATDSERIRRAVAEGGYEAVLTSTDHPTGTDRVAEAAERFHHDVIINVQGDEPFLPPSALDRIATALLDDPTLPMHTLAVPLVPADFEDPNVVKLVVDGAGNALYFSRSPIPHRWRRGKARPLMHVGIYGFQREALFHFVALERSPLEETEGLEQLRALEAGMTIRVGVHEEPFHGIETPEDLQAARGASSSTGKE